MNDGGPAFPASGKEMGLIDGHVVYEQPGMSLRDWFAGMTIATLDAELASFGYEQIARWAYKLAYAMLMERGRILPSDEE